MTKRENHLINTMMLMGMAGNNYTTLESPAKPLKKKPEKVITSTAKKRANGKRKSLKRKRL